MKNRRPPSYSGVYGIYCLANQKVYVGSTVDLRERWYRHCRSLRMGCHRNPHLQAAWDLYGENSFELGVLELIPRSELLAAEQKWIDSTNCTDPQFGFNIYDKAGSPGETHVQAWEGFVDPNGHEVTITNLFAFCREHGLDWASMHRLANGKSKLKSYKGWTHKNSPRQRELVATYDGFISPEGDLVGPITNLAAFCRKHNLDNTHMVAVAHGRINSHKGWKYVNGRQARGAKTHTGFVNPDGQKVVIHNLKEFCRTHGLCLVHMYELKSGKRRNHKGWTWSTSDESTTHPR